MGLSRKLRVAGLSLLVSAGGTAVLAGGLPWLAQQWPARTSEDLVALGMGALGAAVLCWYVLTGALGSICLLAAACGRVWVGGEELVRSLGAPILRRVIGASAGAAIATGALLGPAVAAGTDEQDHVELGWSPAASQSPEQEPAAEPADDSEAPEEAANEDIGEEAEDPGDDPATYVVKAGDSLWSIAEAELPGDPTAAQTAQAWPAWYAQNRDVVGDDPDLIHPGQQLHVPQGDSQ